MKQIKSNGNTHQILKAAHRMRAFMALYPLVMLCLCVFLQFRLTFFNVEYPVFFPAFFGTSLIFISVFFLIGKQLSIPRWSLFAYCAFFTISLLMIFFDVFDLFKGKETTENLIYALFEAISLVFTLVICLIDNRKNNFFQNNPMKHTNLHHAIGVVQVIPFIVSPIILVFGMIPDLLDLPDHLLDLMYQIQIWLIGYSFFVIIPLFIFSIRLHVSIWSKILYFILCLNIFLGYLDDIVFPGFLSNLWIKFYDLVVIILFSGLISSFITFLYGKFKQTI